MEDFIFGNRSYYFVSLCLILLAIFLFLFVFEKRKPKAREIVILAVMISLAVVGRIIFFMTPQFKPMAAIVIISAAAFGKESGFLCGALSLFISNIFFGQEPWTPWQMFAFGVVGFFAGVFFHKRFENRKVEKRDIVELCVYGGASTIFLYGFIMDTATVLMYTDRPTIAALMGAYATGFVFNVIHGGSTVIFLALMAKSMIKKINRIKLKFGMFENNEGFH